MNINDGIRQGVVPQFVPPPVATSPAAAASRGTTADAPDTAPVPAARRPQPGAPNRAETVELRPDPAPPSPPAEHTRQNIREAVDRLAEASASNIRADLRIRVDDETDRIVTEVLNANNEVIRQIPPEELLRIAARLDQVVGLLFDRTI